MKPNDPNAPQAVTTAEFMKMFGFTPPSEPAHSSDVAPGDDPKFLASWSAEADRCADIATRKANCGCPFCRLALFAARVHAFMSTETVRAAITGDTSRLAAVARCVADLKAGGAPST